MRNIISMWLLVMMASWPLIMVLPQNRSR